MTERWEQELQRLGAIGAPTGLRERIAEGPNGQGGPAPTGRQRVVAGIVALGVFAAAGAFAFSAFVGGDREVTEGNTAPASELLVITIEIGPEEDGALPDFMPVATLTYGDQRIEACTSGWRVEFADGRSGGALADCAVPDPVIVPIGTEIDVVTVDGDATVEMDPADPTARVLPASVHLDVTWPEGGDVWGSAAFIASIETYEPGPAGSTPSVEASPSVGDPYVEGGEGHVSDVLRVRCTPDGAEVLTPLVSAQPDGLHAQVEPTDAALLLRPDGFPHAWAIPATGDQAGSFVVGVPTGPVSVACVMPRADGSYEMKEILDALAAGPSFELADPGGYYVDPRPSCEGMTTAGHVIIEAGGSSLGRKVADMPESLPARLNGLLPTDEIESAGYPDQTPWRWWRVVRDGEVIAGGISSPGGSFVLVNWSCPGSGIESSGEN